MNKLNEVIEKPSVHRLVILRTWLIFLTFCFIFEITVLEIPGWALMNTTTQTYISLMAVFIGMITVMLILSFTHNQSIVFFASILMQIAFIMCNMKTTHHISTTANHNVVRNACSARLILMALQTSHLTSMAVKAEWKKYALVNVINALMFTIVIFLEFKPYLATFWEIGQLGSMYASSIVSLLVYHFLVEKLNKETLLEKICINDQKENYQRIVNTIQEGVVIVQNHKIEYVNNIGNKLLSTVYGVENFFKMCF